MPCSYLFQSDAHATWRRLQLCNVFPDVRMETWFCCFQSALVWALLALKWLVFPMLHPDSSQDQDSYIVKFRSLGILWKTLRVPFHSFPFSSCDHSDSGNWHIFIGYWYLQYFRMAGSTLQIVTFTSVFGSAVLLHLQWEVVIEASFEDWPLLALPCPCQISLTRSVINGLDRLHFPFPHICICFQWPL